MLFEIVQERGDEVTQLVASGREAADLGNIADRVDLKDVCLARRGAHRQERVINVWCDRHWCGRRSLQ